jgi:RNA polymerase sigma factor (sigma-70 family)
MGTADVETVWRVESARIVAALTRLTGDFGLAEDAAQEAVAEALVSWPRASPANPGGWLMATARRRAIDAIRRRATLRDRYALLAADPPAEPDLDPDRIDDDVLALMFVSCHPVLSRETRVALTLRVVGGLSSEEIARAFLIPVPTVQARITRGKKTIAAAGVPFELPPADERRARLGGVLDVLYVIFTEGSTATSGDRLLRPDVAYEAIRLTRTLAALQPDEPEVHGLLALCELTAARFPARTAPDGTPILLEDQDRRRWDRSAIRRGLAAPARASTKRPRSLRPAGGDRRRPRVGALGRGDRLGPDRPALRGARPGRAVAGGRAQPGRGRGHGLGSGAGPGHRGRPDRLGPAPRFASGADRTRGVAGPPRPAVGGACRAGTGRPAVRQRPRTLGAAAQGGRTGLSTGRAGAGVTTRPGTALAERAPLPPLLIT